MAIVAGDLELWGCVNHPEDDINTAGGAIQDDAHATGGVRMEFVNQTADDELDVVSSAADTRTVTVTGRLASGALDTEIYPLNGTTPVVGTKVFDSFLKAAITTGAKGAQTVTIRKSGDSVTVATIPPNCIETRRCFIAAASSGVQENRYELVYLKNAHGTLSLTAALVSMSADPQVRLSIGLNTAKGDDGTETDRTTAPTVDSWTTDTSTKAVPTGALAAGERIACWIRQQLPASDPAFRSTWTLKLEGNTAP